MLNIIEMNPINIFYINIGIFDTERNHKCINCVDVTFDKLLNAVILTIETSVAYKLTILQL